MGRLLPRTGRPHRRRRPARRRTPGRAGGETRPVPGRAHALDLSDVGADEEAMPKAGSAPGSPRGTRATRRPPLRRRRTGSHPRRLRRARTDATVWPPAPTPTPTRWKPTSSASPPTMPRSGRSSSPRPFWTWSSPTTSAPSGAPTPPSPATTPNAPASPPASKASTSTTPPTGSPPRNGSTPHLIAQLAAEHDQPVTDTDLAPDDPALHRPRPTTGGPKDGQPKTEPPRTRPRWTGPARPSRHDLTPAPTSVTTPTVLTRPPMRAAGQ